MPPGRAWSLLTEHLTNFAWLLFPLIGFHQLIEPSCRSQMHTLPVDSAAIGEYPCEGGVMQRYAFVVRNAPPVFWDSLRIRPPDSWYSLAMVSSLVRIASAFFFSPFIYTQVMVPLIVYFQRAVPIFYVLLLGPQHKLSRMTIRSLFWLQTPFEMGFFMSLVGLKHINVNLELAFCAASTAAFMVLCRWHRDEAPGGINVALQMVARLLVPCVTLYLNQWTVHWQSCGGTGRSKHVMHQGGKGATGLKGGKLQRVDCGGCSVQPESEEGPWPLPFEGCSLSAAGRNGGPGAGQQAQRLRLRLRQPCQQLAQQQVQNKQQQQQQQQLERFRAAASTPPFVLPQQQRRTTNTPELHHGTGTLLVEEQSHQVQQQQQQQQHHHQENEAGAEEQREDELHTEKPSRKEEEEQEEEERQGLLETIRVCTQDGGLDTNTARVTAQEESVEGVASVDSSSDVFVVDGPMELSGSALDFFAVCGGRPSQIPWAEPEQLGPGYEQRLRELVAERGYNLAAVYVRRGCVELTMVLESKRLQQQRPPQQQPQERREEQQGGSGAGSEVWLPPWLEVAPVLRALDLRAHVPLASGEAAWSPDSSMRLSGRLSEVRVSSWEEASEGVSVWGPLEGWFSDNRSQTEAVLTGGGVSRAHNVHASLEGLIEPTPGLVMAG